MSKNKESVTPTPLTRDQKRIQSLETRVGTLEDQMLLCLQFMRYRAEKDAEKKTPLIKAKEIPQA